MNAYFFFAIGALWIIIAAILSSFGRFNFVVAWPKGSINPATFKTIVRLTVRVIVCGWIVPTGVGLWLMWASK